MGLDESPSIVLAGIAAGSPGLLVVDQLDAVSYFSGRMPDSFDAVAEVVDEFRSQPNLKVMLVCRTTDVENDPRLRSLLRADSNTGRRTLKSGWTLTPCRPTRGPTGLEIESSETMELLRTPFTSLCTLLLSNESGAISSERCRTDTAPDPDIRRRAEVKGGALDCGESTPPRSSPGDNETLTVSSDQVGQFAANQLAALESEGLLVSDMGGLLLP
ncbi:MAG: hypothetical protein IPH03_08475 [Tetrasphaera sp.]|nr:hypothetical protein [Tetrasphaera sp.]